MSSKTVANHNAKDTFGCPFCVGWGTGVPSVAPHTVGVAELGSHSSRKPSGSSLTSGSAKNPRFCEAKTSILVPMQSRGGIRFAFCEQGDGSSLTRAASKNLRTKCEYPSVREALWS